MKALSHKRARSLLHIPDKDLSAVQQADLANHLTGCPECQMYAADLRKLQQVLIRAMDTRWDDWYPSTTSSLVIQRRWKEEKMKQQTVKLIAVLACLVAIIALITYGPGFVSSPLAVSVPPTETQVPIAETQTTPTVVEINQELSSFHAPNHYGWGMDISRDWNRVATGSDDGIAKIWDLTTQGEALALNENAGIADDVAFSPDDTRVAVSYQNGTTIVWDASTGEKLLSLPGASWATSVDFSPDGKLLAVGYYTKGIVQLWNLQTGETSLTLKGHDSVVDDVVFSPDGKRLLTASADGTSKVWEVATGMELLTLYPKYLGHVFAGDFSPDGSLVVTVDWSGYGAVWDVATGSLQSELAKNVRKYNLKYYDVAFSPDGKSIATASTGGEAIIWDASTGEQLMKFACDDQECDNVEFSPDGNTLATSGIKDIVKFWDLTP